MTLARFSHPSVTKDLKELIDVSKFHIRVPRIPEFNREENIENSVKWIKNVLKVEPEVFDYFRSVEVPEL